MDGANETNEHHYGRPNESNITSNLTFFLLPFISLFFVFLDSVELFRASESWEYSKTNFNGTLFEECAKYPILARTGFTIFSLLAAISAFIISFLVAVNFEFFVSKISRTFIHMNYVIFGPYMLGTGLLALIHWDKVLYLCDKDDGYKRFFSFPEMFNLICCFLLSVIITLGMELYECISLYIDSILRRENGNKILRKVFWYIAMRNMDISTIRQ